MLGNIIKARALLEKGQGQGGSLANSKKGRGLKAKLPVLFLPPRRRIGEGWRRIGGGPIRAPRVTTAAGIEGERGRELRGIDPRPHLERWWRVAA